MASTWMNWAKTISPKARPVWSIAILIAVGALSFLRYPLSERGTFYSTAASVIATLWVAVALFFATKESTSGTKEPASGEMTFEHWVFMVASSAGLLASLRALSVGTVHDAWQTRLLTGLTVAGVTAAILLVAERLITWRGGAGNPLVVLWTVLFTATAVVLAIFP